MPDGTPVGALCVIDGQPREWTDGDLVALEDLASCASDEIKLRATVHIIDRERRRTQRYSAMRDSVATTFMAPDLTVEARLEGLLKAGCKAFGVRAARIARVDGGQIQMLFEQKIPTRNCNGTAFEWSAPLTRVLTSECRIVHFDDLPQNFRTVGAKGITVYAGVPLVLNGVLYGVMEFAGSAPRSEMWNNDDLSVLSIMAMLATTQLGMLDQITTLRKTESALVRELSVLKRATV